MQQKPLRVMTYNIHGWAGRDERLDVSRLAHVIRAADADIVTLNEVLHPVTTTRKTYEPLAELADRLDMHFAFGASGWTESGPSWHGPLGNAILSRYPLAAVRNTMLPRPFGAKQRSLLEARLAAGPAKGLTAFATHLDHALEFTRILQIEAALEHIRRQGPHFIAGDFNTPGFYGARTRHFMPPILRMMRNAGYRDAFHVAGRGRGYTFPAPAPLVRIDFVFLPDRWANGLRSVHALNLSAARHASDHRPVVAEWDWSDEYAGVRLAAEDADVAGYDGEGSDL